MTLYPVVMAGGSGTRFWPLSRKARPKQFLALATRKPLVVETVARLGRLAAPGRTYVVCGPLHAPWVRRLLPRLPAANVLIEPVARNTAPAIGLATLEIQARDPEGILAVLPSDHHVADVRGFQRVLRRAAEVARAGSLVTIGIRPTRPETGYGYVQLGEPIDGSAYRVRAFVEKPDAPTAAEYLASGDYLWNGGIFVFTARAMREAIERHLPELGKVLSLLEPTVGTRRHPAALKRHFPRAPAVSIDYGVMEKARDIAVVPGDFGWSDVGSFAALPEVRPADAEGNVVMGEGAILIDSAGCVVVGSGRPLGVVGLRELVVVDSGDAVLVVPRDRSQDVRAVVQALRQRGFQKFE
jgi:mannose-1-phosphate guanylyltransferase